MKEFDIDSLCLSIIVIIFGFKVDILIPEPRIIKLLRGYWTLPINFGVKLKSERALFHLGLVKVTWWIEGENSDISFVTSGVVDTIKAEFKACCL